jgi:chloride channel 3/4/5
MMLAYTLVALRALWRTLRQWWRASQGWVLCGLVGLCTGLLASMVDMCVHWVTDLRLGMCKDEWSLSNKYCCAMVGPTNFTPHRNNKALQQVCPLWQNWDVILREWGVPMLPIGDYASVHTLNYIAPAAQPC